MNKFSQNTHFMNIFQLSQFISIVSQIVIIQNPVALLLCLIVVEYYIVVLVRRSINPSFGSLRLQNFKNVSQRQFTFV